MSSRRLRVLALIAVTALTAACAGTADTADTTIPAEGTTTTGAEVTTTAAETTTTEQAASSWQPEGDVTIVVPGSPGGGGDILARTLQAGLADIIPEVTINVDNRPGGGTAIAYTYLLTKDGDPHYLAILVGSTVTVSLVEDTVFHWSDFTPIAITETEAPIIAVRADSPYETFEQFAEDVRGGTLIAGVTSAAATSALAFGEIAENLEATYSPVYLDSGGDVLLALLAGDVPIAALSPAELAGSLEAGELRPLMVVAPERLTQAAFTEVPTVEEVLGFTPLGGALDFRGFLAAGNLTEEQHRFWEEALVAWTETEQYAQHIETNLVTPQAITGSDLVDYLTTFEEQRAAALSES